MYNPVPGVLPNVPASKNYAGGFGVGQCRRRGACVLELCVLCNYIPIFAIVLRGLIILCYMYVLILVCTVFIISCLCIH